MAFVSLNSILAQAREEHYAVVQINLNGQLWIESALSAAQSLQAPIILAASDRLVDELGGFRTITALAYALYNQMSITVPVVLHLDHGSSVERCFQAIDAGFSSVMFDGSHLSLANNIIQTQRVVQYAHARGVSVEGEVGSVGGMEDGVIGGISYARPLDAIEFVEKSAVDALAAALGSVHGKYQGEPQLDFKRMKQISDRLTTPLVLHGASGIEVSQIQKCIMFGHAKVNYNTELTTTWADALRQELRDNPQNYEPRLVLAPVKEALTNKIKSLISDLGAQGKA